ncbi:MAG TPA: hypothetical protein VKF79_08025 [Candidatus Acidoferrum sp.]|nr:hypothetical protein [Candidatus Acidoferrum sp.]
MDQRHSVSLGGSYRLAPTVRLGVKNLYGSGFPVELGTPMLRLSPYERLDLRIDKSWLLTRWKLTLYAELLNTTNHYNAVFLGTDFLNTNGNVLPVTEKGVPITPTVGLGFDI